MVKISKFFLIIILILFVLRWNALSVFAYDSEVNNMPPKLFDISQLFLNIPAPIADFINAAKQIGENFSRKNTRPDLNTGNPINTYETVNKWFSGLTGGTSLTEIIKPIGNLIVWTLSLFADLIRRAVSLL